MNNPNHYQHIEEAARLIAIELKKTKESEEKLKRALKEIFPVDLYKSTRKLPPAYTSEQDIINHYINHGIDEIDLKEAIGEQKREREKKLKDALKEVFPLNLYKQARQLPKEYNKEDDFIEHFVNHGINEFDFKKSIDDYTDSIFLRNTTGCIRDSGILNEQVSGNDTNKARRILLKTQGDASNLVNNENHQFAIEHTGIHYKSNSLCTWIPKNACSNLRCAIAIGNGAIAGISEIEWIHANNDCFVASTKEVLEANFTFIILRNPFRRLLSFFLDKLCHSHSTQREMSYELAKNLFEFNPEMSYEDFVNHIWKNKNKIYEDEHTRPQCDFILYRDYDRYYSVERLNEAFEDINRETGMEIYDTRDTNSIYTSKGNDKCEEISYKTNALDIINKYNQKKSPVAQNMYSNDMIKKVASIYLSDIFLYATRIPDGRSELEYWLQRAF